MGACGAVAPALKLHRLHDERRAGTAHDRLFGAPVPRVTAKLVHPPYSPSHEVRCLMMMEGGSDEPVIQHKRQWRLEEERFRVRQGQARQQENGTLQVEEVGFGRRVGVALEIE